MPKFICNSEKYVIGGPKEDSIGLLVSFSGLPEKIKVEGYELLRRSLFHTTLVALVKLLKSIKLGLLVF